MNAAFYMFINYLPPDGDRSGDLGNLTLKEVTEIFSPERQYNSEVQLWDPSFTSEQKSQNMSDKKKLTNIQCLLRVQYSLETTCNKNNSSNNNCNTANRWLFRSGPKDNQYSENNLILSWVSGRVHFEMCTFCECLVEIYLMINNFIHTQ